MRGPARRGRRAAPVDRARPAAARIHGAAHGGGGLPIVTVSDLAASLVEPAVEPPSESESGASASEAERQRLGAEGLPEIDT